MEDRLKTRFGWGLTVAVEPPDLEMRVAILLKKAELEGVSLDQPVAFFIAQQVQSNVRELEGALKRVLAFCRFSGQPIHIDSCREALRDLIAVQNGRCRSTTSSERWPSTTRSKSRRCIRRSAAAPSRARARSLWLSRRSSRR